MKKFEDKPLSERLQWHIDYLQGPNFVMVRDTMRIALALAKRVEGAPTVEIIECNQIPGASDYDYGDMLAATAPLKPGQRVAIVPIDTSVDDGRG